MIIYPASLKDRPKTYQWLTASDATPYMMGTPNFPDHPIPSWEDFCQDYRESFFTADGDGYGRVFLINPEGEDIGCISYDGLKEWSGIAEIDIWIASSHNWGKGYGQRAIRELCDLLFSHWEVKVIMIRPSQRNKRAIAVYEKAGFRDLSQTNLVLPTAITDEGLDFQDAIVLVKSRFD
jgi:diamine N-acetyltransferase